MQAETLTSKELLELYILIYDYIEYLKSEKAKLEEESKT